MIARLGRPKHPWVDGLVLFLLFSGLNVIAFPDRLGWHGIHPNPYLLIPVLLGGRYGSGVGLYAACATVLLFGLYNYAENSVVYPEAFLRDNAVLFLSFFIFALASGEVQIFFRKKAGSVELLLEASRTKLTSLDRDIRRIVRVNRELQERLLVSDNRSFAMDLEIRSLYECRVDELWEKALIVLERTEQVSCAALYGPPGEDGTLPLRGSIGGEARLNKPMTPGDSALVAESLSRGEMTVLPDLLGRGVGQSEEFLFAKPLFAEELGLIGLLVVARMPFLRLDAQALSRIDLTMDWISEILFLRTSSDIGDAFIEGIENKKLLSPSHLRKMITLSVAAWRELRVPSCLVTVTADPSTCEPDKLLALVNRRVRAGDFLCRVEGRRPNAVLLLPFTSERGNGIFMESCREILKDGLPGVEITMDALLSADFSSVDEVWRKIEERVSGDLG